MTTIGEHFVDSFTGVVKESVTVAKGEGVQVHTASPGNQILLMANGGLFAGVAAYGGAAGESINVITQGVVMALAKDNTAIAIGDAVSCDAAGRWIPSSTSSNYPVHGTAVSAAPGTGTAEQFYVRIPANYPAVLA